MNTVVTIETDRIADLAELARHEAINGNPAGLIQLRTLAHLFIDSTIGDDIATMVELAETAYRRRTKAVRSQGGDRAPALW